LAAALVALGLSSERQQDEAFAVPLTQLAGRIPGLSAPDVNGLRTYRRPDAKSGGHGVGWSPMTPYTFKVPQDWEEVPVSIADLGGTEIDLRFSSPQEGNISVVVAPVLRFSSSKGFISNLKGGRLNCFKFLSNTGWCVLVASSFCFKVFPCFKPTILTRHL
jgi:hypothetical protein